MRVAIIHDWLATSGGAEQVLAQLLLCYPQADVFCLVDFLPESERGFLNDHRVTTSFIQRLPFARKHFRYYLPLMPKAIENLRLLDYDLIISSSWAFSKGVLTNSSQTHVSYIYTPIRYAFELKNTYISHGVNNFAAKAAAKRVLDRIKQWDINTSHRPDCLIAASRFIADRITKYWQRESTVINPPVALDDFVLTEQKEDYYVTVSRLVHYKAVDVLIHAFNQMPDKQLIVIGEGPMYNRLKGIANPNISLVGYQPRELVIDYVQRARAFMFAALEDFGIVLVEAQASGTPVIAYGRGGAADSVVPYDASLEGPRPTGLFFDKQTADSVINAVKRFEDLPNGISAEACVANAARFSPKNFRREIMAAIEKAMERKAGVARSK